MSAKRENVLKTSRLGRVAGGTPALLFTSASSHQLSLELLGEG